MGFDYFVVDIHQFVVLLGYFDGRDDRAVWFRQQEPVSVLTLEYLEVTVEKCLKLFKGAFVTNLLFGEIGSVY